MHLNKIIYNEEAVEEESATQTTAEKIRAAVAAAYKQLTASMTTLFCRNKTLAILLLTVLVMELESHAVAMLPLYIDYRYSKVCGPDVAQTYPTRSPVLSELTMFF